MINIAQIPDPRSRTYDVEVELTGKLAEHECQEKGIKFDKSKVTEPMTIYQVKGTGATIEDRPAEKPAEKTAEHS